MDIYEDINQYDLVEIVFVPDQYKGMMEIGDVGVVLEKDDQGNLTVECAQTGGCTWLATLSIRDVRLRSKDPYQGWVDKSLKDQPLMKRSLLLGGASGAAFGGLIGAGSGALTLSLNGALVGLIVGLLLGGLTGVLTAALTVKTAGTTGGIGVGYFTGMVFGGVFGMIVGMLVPTSWRLRANTEGIPVLDVLVMGRFETAMLISFLLSILGTMVGTWVGGKNFIPRNLKERYRS